MLDTRRLRVLCEVARYGSFSGAAASLGYTQPAVSRQIATLEAEVGALLVRRVPQGAVLTDAGQLLVARGKEILARLEDAEAELLALAGLEGGRLRLASFAVGRSLDRATCDCALSRALSGSRAQHRDGGSDRLDPAPARRGARHGDVA